MSIYLKADCDAMDDPKLLAVGPDGFTLYFKGLMYAKKHLTDGFVPAGAVPVLAAGIKNTKALIRLMIAVDLWRECDGGYTCGSERWANRQTTKEQVEDKREKTKERVARFREAKRNATVTPLHTSVTEEECNAPVTRGTEYRAQSTELLIGAKAPSAHPPDDKPNHAYDPVLRVLCQVAVVLDWKDPKHSDVVTQLKPDAPIPTLIDDYGEDGAIEMFLFANDNWAPKRPTWPAVCRNRNQLWDQMECHSVNTGRAKPTNGGLQAKANEFYAAIQEVTVGTEIVRASS